MAFIKRRGNKWYAIWTQDGKRITKATGIEVRGKKEEKLAQQTAAAMEAAAKGNLQLTRALDSVRSAAEALGVVSANPIIQDYLTNFKPAGGESNARNFANAINTFLDYLGSAKLHRIDRLTPAMCRNYCIERLKQVSYGTAKHNLAHLRCAFNAAVRDGMIDRNPFNSFSLSSLAPASMPRAIKRLPFSTEEMYTIITKFPEPWPELALTSLLTGGQRLGDICCLQWKHINSENNTVSFNTKKTGKEIIVPIHPSLKQIFSKRQGNNSEYVFPEAARKYIRWKGGLSVEFTNLLKAYGILKTEDNEVHDNRKALSRKSFHSIRHTVVTLLRSSNQFTADITRQIVGHDSEEIERQYFTASTDSKAQGISYLFNTVTKSEGH
jgi:integrase